MAPEQLLDLPLLHDAHDHWPDFLHKPGKLPGAVFNQTTLALDAALAGQGVAIAARAFVRTDLQAGQLVQVAESTLMTGPDYYLVRRRLPVPREAADSFWEWCATQLLSR